MDTGASGSWEGLRKGKVTSVCVPGSEGGREERGLQARLHTGPATDLSSPVCKVGVFRAATRVGRMEVQRLSAWDALRGEPGTSHSGAVGPSCDGQGH